MLKVLDGIINVNKESLFPLMFQTTSLIDLWRITLCQKKLRNQNHSGRYEAHLLMTFFLIYALLNVLLTVSWSWWSMTDPL